MKHNIYPRDYCCINTSTNIWFCVKCKVAHAELYVSNENDEKYCPQCVPADIKAKSVNITHNNEIMD